MAALKLAAKIVGASGSACCCGGDCCLYPAEHDWGDGSDLPNKVIISGHNFTRSGIGFYQDDGDAFIEIPGTTWNLSNWNEESGSFGSSLCLISDSYGILVEDDFPDALTLEVDDGLGTVVHFTRISLCVWQGDIPGYFLFFGIYDGNGDAWSWHILNPDGGVAKKDNGDNNSTPLGSYSIGAVTSS